MKFPPAVCIALVVFFLFDSVAQASVAGWSQRLDTLEQIARTFLRDNRLEIDQVALQEKVTRYNASVARAQAAELAAQSALDADLMPLRALEKKIEASTAAVQMRPDPRDRIAVERYNTSVSAHNNLVTAQNELAGRLAPLVEAQRQRIMRIRNEATAESARLNTEKDDLTRRQAAWEAFSRDGGDARYQNDVNRLLADVRTASVSGASAQGARVALLLTRVRALRQELANWAISRAAAQPNGLILVTARIGDEPLCFIFDTGAQSVTLPLDLVRALGWQDRLGEEETIRGVAGATVKGRTIVLPTLSALGQSAQQVSANAMPTAEGIGVDGLLGQSFIKGFRITITPGATPRVMLDAAR